MCLCTTSPTSPSPTPVIRLDRPRLFYDDTPTPHVTLLRKLSRNRRNKPLGDYIDRITGEEHSVCEACRNEIQNLRQFEEIEEHVQRVEEELV